MKTTSTSNISNSRSRVPFATLKNEVESKFYGAKDSSLESKNAPRCSSSVATARDEVFSLGSAVGQLCASFLDVPRDSRCGSVWPNNYPEIDNLSTNIGNVFLALFVTASVCGLDLRTSILKKIELNGRKYPVELCKGKSGKYTNYSEHTGITKTEGQSTVENMSTLKTSETYDIDTVEGVTCLIAKFASDRLWNRYHTPRNIALALLGEVGELAELFQWRGDDDYYAEQQDHGLVGWSEEEIDKVGQEIADVSIYLLRLSDICNIDLGEVTLGLLKSRRI